MVSHCASGLITRQQCAALYFSPDGAYLGAGEHSQLLVWNMDLAALMALAKRLAGRELTEREVEIYVDQPSHQ